MAIREDELKKVFEAHKLPSDLQDYIMGGEVEDENFDFSNSLNNYLDSRADFYKHKFEPEIKDQLEGDLRKDIFASIVKPLTNRIRQAGGFTKEEIEGIEWKQQIDLLVNKYKKEIDKASGVGDEELKQKYDNAVAKWDEYQKEAENWANTYEKKVSEIEASYKAKENDRDVRRLFREGISNPNNIEFDKSSNLYEDIFIDHWFPKFGYELHITEDGGRKKLKITGKGGIKAISLDGNDVYNDYLQAVRDISKHLNILKVSNGADSSGFFASKNKAVVNGKEIDVSSTNALREMMGIK